ncbi:MAG: hypothetical protein IT364_24655 [Candidatus Hydrogenedentes bacterium]|nr:hypothetical protein [Candidatus Hydrogenedentota bacterium]
MTNSETIRHLRALEDSLRKKAEAAREVIQLLEAFESGAPNILSLLAKPTDTGFEVVPRALPAPIVRVKPSKKSARVSTCVRGKQPRRCSVCGETKGVTAFQRGQDVCRKCGVSAPPTERKHREDGFVLTESPPKPRPLLKPGMVNERGEFCMTPALYAEHKRNQVDKLYKAIRKACKQGQHAQIRLMSPTGVFVEVVLAEEIW